MFLFSEFLRWKISRIVSSAKKQFYYIPFFQFLISSCFLSVEDNIFLSHHFIEKSSLALHLNTLPAVYPDAGQPHFLVTLISCIFFLPLFFKSDFTEKYSEQCLRASVPFPHFAHVPVLPVPAVSAKMSRNFHKS